jgi:hypothetical protein
MNVPHYNGAPGEASTDANESQRDGGGLPYVCLGCEWHGRGGLKAVDHMRATGHRAVPRGLRIHEGGGDGGSTGHDTRGTG